MKLTNFELEKINYENSEHVNYLKGLMKSKDMDYLWDLSDKSLYSNRSSTGYIVKKKVEEHKEEPIGYLNLSMPIEAYYGHTVSLYYAIEGTKRGNGYGKQLIEDTIQWSLSTGGIDCIIAQVEKENIYSQNTLKKAGMIQVGGQNDEYITFIEHKNKDAKRR